MGELEDEVLRQRRAQQIGSLWQKGIVEPSDPVLIRPVGRTGRLVNELVQKITRWDSVLVATDPEGVPHTLDTRSDLHEARFRRLGVPGPDFSGGPKQAMAEAGYFQSQRSWKRQSEVWFRHVERRTAESNEARRKLCLAMGAKSTPGRWISHENCDSYGDWYTLFACCVLPDGLIAPRKTGAFGALQPKAPADLEAQADGLARSFATWLESSSNS